MVIILLLLSSFIFCDYDAVVIGSGISGLTVSSILSQAGKKVALLEQCPNLGGTIQYFKRKGNSGLEYSFESGLHILGNIFPPSMFDWISSNNVTMEPFGDVIDHVYINGTNDPIELPSTLSSYFDEMKVSFPDESEAIDTFVQAMKNTTSETKTLEGLLDVITTNPDLKYALSYMSDYTSMTPFSVVKYSGLLQWCLTNGASFPIGSTENIVEGTLSMIKSNGGKIHSNCATEKLILSEDGDSVKGVQSKCGTFDTKTVVSSMGARNTFNVDFIDKSVLQKYGYLDKVKTLIDSNSANLHFLGFNASNEVLKFPKANIWYRNGSNDTASIFTPLDVYTSSLSARDPLSPKDRSDIFIMVDNIDFDLFKEWEDTKTHQRPKSYYDFKQKFEDAALEWFFQFYPDSRKYLDVVVTSTPLTIRDYLAHHRGSVYGVSVQLEDDSWLVPKTKIEGLYMTGQDLYGSGVQNNLMHGFELAKQILSEMD